MAETQRDAARRAVDSWLECIEAWANETPIAGEVTLSNGSVRNVDDGLEMMQEELVTQCDRGILLVVLGETVLFDVGPVLGEEA